MKRLTSKNKELIRTRIAWRLREVYDNYDLCAHFYCEWVWCNVHKPFNWARDEFMIRLSKRIIREASRNNPELQSLYKDILK